MPRKLPFGLTDALASPFANIATHSTLELHIPQGRRPARSLYLATAGITYQGVTYTGTLKGFSAIRHSLNRAADEVQLSIRNEELGQGLEFLFYLDALNGAEAKVGRYWWQDANKEFHKVLLVGRASITDITDTEVKLKIVSDFYSNVNVGATRSLTRECGFKFRDSQTCGYSGAELKCNKLLNSADGCLGRHGDPLHRAKFGGFAYIDTASTVSGAAALAAPASNQLIKAGTSTYAQRSAIKVTGATVTDNAAGDYTEINFSSSSASVPWIYVDDAAYGVVGDGSTDDRTAIQAVLDAVPSTGAVVMFGRKTYYVSGAVLPKAHTVLMGQGYSTVIKCPDAGWTLASPSNMGIINFYNVDNVRVTNLRVRGTKVQTDINLSPKLIFAHTVNNITVDHCWLENSNHEGFWPGNVINDLIITDNDVYDVGVSNTYGGLPALQIGAQYAVVANNRLQTVGIGIQGSNGDISITGNLVRDVRRYGIGTGDGSPGGNIAISGNVVEVTEGSVVRYGFYIDGTALSGSFDDYAQQITGNTVRITGTGSGAIVTGFYGPNPRNANFTGNSVDITYRGQGFSFSPTVTSYTVRITAIGNVVRVKSESAKCVGFVTSVNGASTGLQIHSKNNAVYGLTRTPHSSYAYDYSPNSGTPGTLGVFMVDDWTEQGYIRVSTTLSNVNGEYDKTPLNWTSNNFPSVSLKNHLQIAEITAPSTPQSGNFAFYAKTDGLAYGKNDAGTELDLTLGNSGTATIYSTDVLANTDGSGSIGASGANRFANCYIRDKITVGANGGSYKLNVTGTPTGTVMVGIIPSSLTSGDIMIYQNLPATTGNISAATWQGAITGTLDSTLFNTNNSSGTAHAKIESKSNGASGGDAVFTATISGVLNFSFGLDNSDSDAFVFSTSSTLGTNNSIRISTSDQSVSFGSEYGGPRTTGSGTGAQTLDWGVTNQREFTLTGNVTFTFSNPRAGHRYLLLLKQDGTGGRTTTFPTIKWTGGAAPALTTTANAVDILEFYYDGTNYYETRRSLDVK